MVNALSNDGQIYQILVAPDLQNIADVRGPFTQTGAKILQFQTIDQNLLLLLTGDGALELAEIDARLSQGELNVMQKLDTYKYICFDSVLCSRQLKLQKTVLRKNNLTNEILKVVKQKQLLQKQLRIAAVTSQKL